MKKTMILFLIIIFFPLLANAQSDNDLKDPMPIKIGLSGAFNTNFHSASIKDLLNLPPQSKFYKPLMFKSGLGFGFSFGASIEAELSKDFSIEFRPAFSVLNGLFTRTDKMPFSKLNENGDSIDIINGKYEQTLSGSISALDLALIGSYNVMPSLRVNLGLAPSLLMTKSYEFKEKINANGLKFEDGRSEHIFKNDIDNASGFQFGIVGGATYSIPMNRDSSLLLEPYALFTYNLTSISDTYKWNVNHLSVGVNLKYAINKPIDNMEKERIRKHIQFKEDVERRIASIKNTKIHSHKDLDSLDTIKQNLNDYSSLLSTYPDSKYNKERKTDVNNLQAQANDLSQIISAELKNTQVLAKFQAFIEEKDREIGNFEKSKETFDNSSLEEFRNIKKDIESKTSEAKQQLEGDNQKSIVAALASLQQRVDKLIAKSEQDISLNRQLLDEEEQRNAKHNAFISSIDSSLSTIKNTYHSIGKDLAITKVNDLKTKLQNYSNEVEQQPDSMQFQKEGKQKRKSSIAERSKNAENLISEIKGLVEKLPGFDISEILIMSDKNKINSFAINSDGRLCFVGLLKDSLISSLVLEKSSGSLLADYNIAANYADNTDSPIEASPKDEGISVAVSEDDLFYFTGYFNQSINLSNETYTSEGKADVFLAEYTTTSGNITWSQHIPGKEDSRPKDIAVIGKDNDFKIIVTGTFNGKIKLLPDQAETANNILTSDTKSDNFFIVGYNGMFTGEVSFWKFKAKGIANKLLILNDDFLFAAGSINSESDFGGKKIAPKQKNTNNSFITKFDHYKDGELQWVYTFNGDNNAAISLANEDSDHDKSNIFVLGEFSGQLEAGGKTKQSNNNSKDLYIASLSADKEGVVNWLTSIGGANNETGYDIKARFDKDRNEQVVYVTGTFVDSITIANVSYTSKGKEDFFIAAISGKTGEIIKVATFGSVGQDYCNKMYVYENEVYLIGYTENGINFNSNSTKIIKPKVAPYKFLIKIN